MDAVTLGLAKVDAAKKSPRGNTIVVFGNSRIEREIATGFPGRAADTGVFGIANAKAGGRFQVLNNAGVSGDTFTQMIARWQTDVAAYSPQWVYIADPVNDATGNHTTAQMIADAKTMIALAKGAGTRVILATAPPNGAHTTAQRAALNGYNTWVKWGNTDGWAVPVDVASVVTNAQTSNWQTPYSTDDLHQTRAGAARMARVLAPVLASIVPPRDPFPATPGDTAQAISNPWLFGTVGASLPSGWVGSGSGTFSTVARTDLAPGNWVQIDTTAASASTNVSNSQVALPSGFVPGDKVRFAVEVQTDAWTSFLALGMQVQFRNSSSAAVGTVDAFSNRESSTLVAADQFALNETWTFVSPIGTIPTDTAFFKVIHTWNAQGKVRFGRHALIRA